MAEGTIYRYVPHRRTQARLAGEPSGPVKVVDQLPSGSKPARFNAWLADKRSEATYNDADAVLHEAVKIQEHLVAQDKVLGVLIDKAQGLPG